MAHKPIYAAPTPGGLALTDKLILLEPVALWIHERGEKRTEVSRSELETKLAEGFGEQLGFAEARARQQAKAFVDLLERRAMPLIQRDQDTYAFVHLNLQVSLAARALAGRTDLVEVTLKHLHDPWWREVHLQAVAHLSSPCTRRSQTETQKLIRAFQNAGSCFEGELHRDLLFAFDALCDVGLLGVETQFRQELTQEVFRLWLKTNVKPLQSDIEDRFSYAGTTPVCSHLVGLLLPLTESWTPSVRSRVAHALGCLGSASATPVVLARLLELSRDGKSEVYSSAIVGLGRLGSAAATPEVLAQLFELIQDCTRTVETPRLAATALSRMVSAAPTQAEFDRLMEFSHDYNPDMRFYAVALWGRWDIATPTPEVLSRLVELSQDCNTGVRILAAKALGNFGRAAATPEVLARLLELIQDGDDFNSAAVALGLLGNAAATPEVLARLMALIQDGNCGVRSSAEVALATFGRAAATPEVLARLLGLIQAGEASVSLSAAAVLGRLGSEANIADILARLLELTHDDDPDVRSSAADALGNLGGGAATPAVLTRLLEVSQDGNSAMRSTAAAALGALGSPAATAAVLARLVELIQDGDDAVRSYAAVVLGGLGSAAATPEVLAKLFELIEDGDTGMIYRSAVALGQMMERLNPEQLESLEVWSRTHLSDQSSAPVSCELKTVSTAAFEILHRLAARRVWPAPARADARAKAKHQSKRHRTV